MASPFEVAWGLLKALPEQQMFVEPQPRFTANEHPWPSGPWYDVPVRRTEINPDILSVGTVNPIVRRLLSENMRQHQSGWDTAMDMDDEEFANLPPAPPNLNLGLDEHRAKQLELGLHPDVPFYHIEEPPRGHGGFDWRWAHEAGPKAEMAASKHDPDRMAPGSPWMEERRRLGDARFAQRHFKGDQRSHKITHPDWHEEGL